MCETLKSRTSTYKFYFYSNTLTKDPFRNTLLKKIKSVFGFHILEDIVQFSDVVESIDENNAEWISKLEVFFSKDFKPKSFKHIKKYMENVGLKSLKDDFFQDVANKMAIMR
jgi:hypothetical protein